MINQDWGIRAISNPGPGRERPSRAKYGSSILADMGLFSEASRTDQDLGISSPYRPPKITQNRLFFKIGVWGRG